MLAAADKQSVVGYSVVEGSFNTELFNFMFENMILPDIGLVADKEPRSVVILENCRIHDSDEFIDMVRNKSGIVTFLPPYSPDLNPVEFLFRSYEGLAQAPFGLHFSRTKECSC